MTAKFFGGCEEINGGREEEIRMDEL